MNQPVLINELYNELYIEIPKENKLAYKKSYMHMLNKYAYNEGAIDKELFDDAKSKIDKIDKV